MKYKLIAMSAVIIMLSVGLALSLSGEAAKTRYHQHREITPASFAPCEHISGEFCTHLPIVSITTTTPSAITAMITAKEEQRTVAAPATAVNYYEDGSHVSKINPLPTECEVKIYDKSGAFNHITDTPTSQSLATYGKRGNSSFYFDKSSYKLELFNADTTENHDIEFLGMPKHNEWALNGPFLDKTMLRNYLSFNIAGEIMKNTPRVRYFEMFIDGEYKGLYLAMESIDRSDDRVPLTKYSDGDPFTSYIVRADRKHDPANELNNFTRYADRRNANSVLEVIYPPIVKRTPELMEYIEDDFSRIEKAIYSFDYKSKEYGYHKLLDRDSFVDYLIINEISKNADAGIYSTYYYKDVRGKLHIGPVWDFNNAYDNYMEVSHDYAGFVLIDAPIYTMLIKDPEFTDAVIERYRQLRQGVLSEEYLTSYIDNTVAWLGESIDRNYAVWGYSFDAAQLDEMNKLSPDERNPSDYQESLEQLKTFIIERGNWLDKNIENLRQYSHPSRAKKFNH